MKKKKAEQQLPPVENTTNAEPATTTAFPISDMSPSDELQIYYNDAYLKEKQRFNDIFGIIETEKPVAEKVYVEPSLEEYVEKKKFKKVKRIATLFIVLTIALAVVVALFALKIL